MSQPAAARARPQRLHGQTPSDSTDRQPGRSWLHGQKCLLPGRTDRNRTAVTDRRGQAGLLATATSRPRIKSLIQTALRGIRSYRRMSRGAGSSTSRRVTVTGGAACSRPVPRHASKRRANASSGWSPGSRKPPGRRCTRRQFRARPGRQCWGPHIEKTRQQPPPFFIGGRRCGGSFQLPGCFGGPAKPSKVGGQCGMPDLGPFHADDGLQRGQPVLGPVALSGRNGPSQH